MTTQNLALSVLDLVPVRSGQTVAEAVAASVALAQLADRLGFTPLLVRRAPQHAGRRVDDPAGAHRAIAAAHRAHPRRIGRRHAAEPRAARRRRAVRRARGARARAHRPRHRPRARQRPGDHRSCCAHSGTTATSTGSPTTSATSWPALPDGARLRFTSGRELRVRATPAATERARGLAARLERLLGAARRADSACRTSSRTTSRARASSARSTCTAPSSSRARRTRRRAPSSP